MKYDIPRGVFSKKYKFSDGSVRSIAYSTLFQNIALFDGDSAEVWQLLFEDKGNVDRALAYIINNGTFEYNAEVEATKTLNDFIQSLTQLYLIHQKGAPLAPYPKAMESSIKKVIDQEKNPEKIFSSLMANNHIFYSLILELTYRCNERCIHCYCPENRGMVELSLSEISEILDQFESLGGFSLQITGGEPFVRSDINEILLNIARRNIVLNITSNLTLMTSDQIDLVAEIAPRSVGCSIYAAEPSIHDSVTKLPGSFQLSLERIKKLRQRGVPVVIKSPLMSHTIHQWKKIEALAKEFGCGYQFDLNITARNDGGLETLDLRCWDRSAIEELFSTRLYKIYINDEVAQLPPSEDHSDAGLCGAGATGLVISPDGTIRPCLGLITSLGNIKSNSLKEIWENSSFFPEWTSLKVSNIEKCRTCGLFPFCIKCPGSWALETGSVLKPSDYSCFLAEILSRCNVQENNHYKCCSLKENHNGKEVR